MDAMNYQELEESGYVVPMTDIVNNTMLWRIKGNKYETRKLMLKYQAKIGNKSVVCAKISEVIKSSDDKHKRHN